MMDYVLNAAVSLLRNYEDLPFDAPDSEETARRAVERAATALERSGDSFAYLPVADLPVEKRLELEEKRLLSAEAQDAPHGIAYLRMDEKVCVEAASEDHLRISAFDAAGKLQSCYPLCADLEERLENTGKLAKSEAFGFLTVHPCDAGTGLRASLLLHLPMTVLVKQLPAAMKVAAGAGMTLISRNKGLCLLENRVTMGIDENTLLQRVSETGDKLCTLERGLRTRARERSDVAVLDPVWRSYGTGRYALRIGRGEAEQVWSMLTLGLSVSDVMPYTEQMADEIWTLAHMTQAQLTQDHPGHPDIIRAQRIRTVLSGGK